MQPQGAVEQEDPVAAETVVIWISTALLTDKLIQVVGVAVGVIMVMAVLVEVVW
jgi:hypothetical protein